MKRSTRTLLDLAVNLGWPVLILSFAATEDRLGPRLAPLVAMAPALIFAAWRRMSGQRSPLSTLVIVSLGATAATGFLPLDAHWYAVKEATIPLGICLLALLSTRSGPGLIAGLMTELLDAPKLDRALDQRGTRPVFEGHARRATRQLGGLFALSGLLSGGLALWLVRSPSGTTAFATEVGSYTSWSYLLISLPMMVGMVWVMRGVMLAVEVSTGQALDAFALDDATPPGSSGSPG